jgi:hypothetical protein
LIDAIIFHIFTINGALFDVLDYYLYAKYLKKKTKLVLIKTQNFMTPEEVYKQIESRYVLKNIKWKEDIIWIDNHWKMPSLKFNNLVVMDYYTTGILKYTKANHYHLIYDHNDFFTERYKDYIKRSNYTIYNEMPFGIENVVYKLKIPTNLYKIPLIRDCEKNCYINCNRKSISELERALNLTDKNILITNYRQLLHELNVNRNPLGNSFDRFVEKCNRVKVVKYAPEYFFKLWDTYMYIHDGKYFEPRCRLLLEARMMKKKIIYDNQYDIRDGSFYRWNEIKRRKRLPKDRILTEKDLIIGGVL